MINKKPETKASSARDVPLLGRVNDLSSGASLVFALFLMLFLTLVSFSLVMLISHEVKSSTKLYLSQQALYAAEAGVERKIAELKEESSADIAITDFYGAQYEVDVKSLGGDKTEIESTGYVPDKSDYREKRTLSVIVLVNPAVPEHAVAVSGSSVFDGNTTIYGTIRTNSKVDIGQTCRITESSAGKGDASIYSAYDGADWPVIT
ncbi:MAG: pilus assembly PilX N-terminal domain-containing protein, partial [Elusimicrobiota bacterium]|nr:pilus assembly PilX N-terminal domain-containing protein [Elusimicrobiota bacterium]